MYSVINFKNGRRYLNFDAEENLLFNFVFIVRDLTTITSHFKHLHINTGPQKNRGQVDSLARIKFTSAADKQKIKIMSKKRPLKLIVIVMPSKPP